MDFKPNIISQYHAALAMLRQAVEQCPDDTWAEPFTHNAFWRVAYHALFYTHFYLHPGPGAFTAWEKHRPEAHQFDQGGEPYARTELLDYCQIVREDAARLVSDDRLEDESGFHWLPFNRLETHLYNLRHLQQHTGELCERLGTAGGGGVDWVSRG